MTTNQNKLKIFLYYFIQNDSWDSLSQPNVYALPETYYNLNDVKVEHVYSSFPLKHENFYLRFFLDDQKQNAWIDLPPSATVPVYKNRVYAKVLRIPKEVKINFKNDEYFVSSKTKSNKKNIIETKEEDIKFAPEDLKTNNTIKSNMNDKKQDINANKSNNNLPNMKDQFNINEIDLDKIQFKFKDTESSKPVDDIFNIFDTQNNNSQTQAKQKNNDVLIPDITDLPKSTNKINESINSNMSDLDFMTLSAVFSNSANNSIKSEPITVNIKKQKPIDEVYINQDYDIMCEKIDLLIKEWSFNKNERKNLRMLLASLHEVWTIDSSWEDISMKQLIEDEKYLNSIYRKAMLQLHPDKNRNKDIKVKYIAECLFLILNKANEELQK